GAACFADRARPPIRPHKQVSFWLSKIYCRFPSSPSETLLPCSLIGMIGLPLALAWTISSRTHMCELKSAAPCPSRMVKNPTAASDCSIRDWKRWLQAASRCDPIRDPASANGIFLAELRIRHENSETSCDAKEECL